MLDINNVELATQSFPHFNLTQNCVYACGYEYECRVACMYLLLLPRPRVHCLLVKNVFTLVTLHIKNKDPLNKESYNCLRLCGVFEDVLCVMHYSRNTTHTTFKKATQKCVKYL